MADWKDVMGSRQEATDALADVNSYGGSLEEGRDPDVALAVCLATRAVCAELRALGVGLDYASSNAV